MKIISQVPSQNIPSAPYMIGDPFSINNSPPLKEEVVEAMRKLSKSKSVEVTGIIAKHLKQ